MGIIVYLIEFTESSPTLLERPTETKHAFASQISAASDKRCPEQEERAVRTARRRRHSRTRSAESSNSKRMAKSTVRSLDYSAVVALRSTASMAKSAHASSVAQCATAYGSTPAISF